MNGHAQRVVEYVVVRHVDAIKVYLHLSQTETQTIQPLLRRLLLLLIIRHNKHRQPHHRHHRHHHHHCRQQQLNNQQGYHYRIISIKMH
jgi:hypothetical protein